jgi:DNA modification methylase
VAGGSRQLKNYRAARAAGDTREEACAVSGILPGEAELIDADDAREAQAGPALPLRQILIGDALTELRKLPSDSVDCCVTSPPYWGLRDYGVDGQLGMERTLGEHIAAMVELFDEVRRVLKPQGTLWLNYGDCYATKPNGRSAEATKAAGKDDRTFRDKPFSTVGPIYGHLDRAYEKTPRAGQTQNFGNLGAQSGPRVVGVGMLKPKDLCMIPNRLAIALQDAGWWVRSEIVWAKPNPMPDSSGRYRPSTAHEKVWLLTKSAKSYYDQEAVQMPGSAASLPQYASTYEGEDTKDYGAARAQSPSAIKRRIVDKQRGHSRRHQGFSERWDSMSREEQCGGTRLLRNYEPDLSPLVPPEVWNIATAAFREAHFATFPPALVVPCLLAGCPVGGTVLDPFFGAGTTGLVADRLQRSWIGIELNPEYAQIARRRIDGDRGGLLDAMEAA